MKQTSSKRSCMVITHTHFTVCFTELPTCSHWNAYVWKEERNGFCCMSGKVDLTYNPTNPKPGSIPPQPPNAIKDFFIIKTLLKKQSNPTIHWQWQALALEKLLFLASTQAYEYKGKFIITLPVPFLNRVKCPSLLHLLVDIERVSNELQKKDSLLITLRSRFPALTSWLETSQGSELAPQNTTSALGHTVFWEPSSSGRRLAPSGIYGGAPPTPSLQLSNKYAALPVSEKLAAPGPAPGDTTCSCGHRHHAPVDGHHSLPSTHG